MKIIAFLICLLFFNVAHSALQVGKILKVTGANYSLNSKKVGLEAPIFWGDRLFVGKATTLEVVIYPSFLVKIHPSSKLQVIGNIIEKIGDQAGVTAALRVEAGKIHGAVFKKNGITNSIKVFGTKTISSIRGTTFEIDVENDEEVSVFEGAIEVATPTQSETILIGANQALDLSQNNLKAKESQKTLPQMSTESEVEAAWVRDSAQVMQHHSREAKKYKKLLDQDVSKMMKGLKKDASSMFKGLKGGYEKNNRK